MHSFDERRSFPSLSFTFLSEWHRMFKEDLVSTSCRWYPPVYTTPLSSTDMLMLLVPLVDVVRFTAESCLLSMRRKCTESGKNYQKRSRTKKASKLLVPSPHQTRQFLIKLPQWGQGFFLAIIYIEQNVNQVVGSQQVEFQFEWTLPLITIIPHPTSRDKLKKNNNNNKFSTFLNYDLQSSKLSSGMYLSWEKREGGEFLLLM